MMLSWFFILFIKCKRTPTWRFFSSNFHLWILRREPVLLLFWNILLLLSLIDLLIFFFFFFFFFSTAQKCFLRALQLRHYLQSSSGFIFVIVFSCILKVTLILFFSCPLPESVRNLADNHDGTARLTVNIKSPLIDKTCLIILNCRHIFLT